MNNTRVEKNRAGQQRGVMVLGMMCGLVIGVNQVALVNGSAETGNVRTSMERGVSGQTNDNHEELVEQSSAGLPFAGRHQMWDEPDPLDLSGDCEPATNAPAALGAQTMDNDDEPASEHHESVERKSLPQTKKTQTKVVKKQVTSQVQTTVHRTTGGPAKPAANQQQTQSEPSYMRADTKNLPQTGTDSGWGLATIGLTLASMLGLMDLRRCIVRQH